MDGASTVPRVAALTPLATNKLAISPIAELPGLSLRKDIELILAPNARRGDSRFDVPPLSRVSKEPSVVWYRPPRSPWTVMLGEYCEELDGGLVVSCLLGDDFELLLLREVVVGLGAVRRVGGGNIGARYLNISGGVS